MKGVFKCALEGDERRFRSVKRSSLGMPKCTPNKYSSRLKRLSLRMPPDASPSSSTIISLSLVALYFYHFMRYVLCCSNKLDPNLLFCVGEKHAPLELELLIGFACLFILVVSCSFSFLSC